MFARHQPLPFDAAAALVAVLADAVQYAHEQGVIHRDLKPANVLVEAQPADGGANTGREHAFHLPGQRLTPRISDFGLARDLRDDGALTRTGTAVGTALYMSPEQARGDGRAAGPAADVYSLGVILYEALTGRVPFTGDEVSVRRQAAADEPPRPGRLRYGLPRDLETVCLKCLRKPPGERYDSAGELRDELRRYLDGQPVRARPVRAWERAAKWCRRHRAVTALIGVVLLSLAAAAAGGVAFGVVQDRHRRETDRLLAAEEEARREADRRGDQLVRANEQMRQQAYAADVLTASEAWYSGDLKRMRQLLARLVPGPDETDLRGWEWRYLWERCQAAERPLLSWAAHKGWAWGLTVTADGLIYTSGQDRIARCWRPSDGGKLREWPPDPGPIEVGGWLSRDGRTLVSAHIDHRIKVWDMPAGKPRTTWRLPERIERVVCSDDGRLVAATTLGGRIFLHRDGKLLREWKAHPGGERTALMFSHCGRLLASANAGTELHIWDVATAQGRRVPYPVPGGYVAWLAFNHDASCFAVCDKTVGRVLLYETGSLRLLRSWNALGERATDIRFSPDGNWLAISSYTGQVCVWHTWSGDLGLLLDAHPANICCCLSFSPRGDRLVTVGSDGQACVWSLGSLAHHRHSPAPSRIKDYTFAFSPDGRHARAVPHEWMRAASADGSRTATALPLGFLLQDSSTGRTTRHQFDAREPVGWHHSPRPMLALSASGRRLAAVRGLSVRLWDAEAGQERHRLLHANGITSMAFSPDERTLATTCEQQGQLTLWHAATGQRLMTLLSDDLERVSHAAFSADGSALAAVNRGRAHVWTVPSRDLAGNAQVR